MATGSPYYKWKGSWLRGLKPQLVVPPIEDILGTYIWAGYDSNSDIELPLEEGLTLKLVDKEAEATPENLHGYLGGLFFGGKLVGAKEMKDEEGVGYWELEFTGDATQEVDDFEPGGRYWKLYVSEFEDEHGYSFIEVREVNGFQYAYGKRQYGSRAIGFTDSDKEFLKFLPVSYASLSEEQYQDELQKLSDQEEDDEMLEASSAEDEDNWGAPYYTFEGRSVIGLDPRPVVPPIEDLLGRYSWAEHGLTSDGHRGPMLKEGLILKLKDSNQPAAGKNIGGYMETLAFGGAVLGVQQKKDKWGVEYWEVETDGEIWNDDYDPDSDHEHGYTWHLYVSKELDDNGSPFVELTLLDDYGPFVMYGFGKRQVDGQKPCGFTPAEKKRIGFMTNKENSEKRHQEYLKEMEERNKKWEEEKEAKRKAKAAETPAQRAARVAEIQRQQEENKRKKQEKKEANLRKVEEQKLQAQRRREANGAQVNPVPSLNGSVNNGHLILNAGPEAQSLTTTSGQNGHRRRRRTHRGSRRKNEAGRTGANAEPLGVGDRNSQIPTGSGQMVLATPKQATVQCADTNGRVHHPLPSKPQLISGSTASSHSLVPFVKQEVTIKREPVQPFATWGGTSFHHSDNQNLKRPRDNDDDATNSKRIKRED